MPITQIIPQLRTTDLEATPRFYTQRLGLLLDFRYQDFYAGIRVGDRVALHLKQVDAADPSIGFVAQGEHVHLYLEVDDVRALAQRLKREGLPLVKDVHDTPWGRREILLRDDQGHTLAIGERA